MKLGELVGLAFFGGGTLLLIVYGVYNMDLSDIDPLVLTGTVAIFLGIIILFISILTERRSKDMEGITKEDLRP